MRQRGGGKRSKRTAREKRGFRLNPRRQFLYALLTLAALLGGYGVGTVLNGSDVPTGGAPARTVASDTARPWYRSQPPPPTFVTIPDAPLFPEPTGGPAGEPVRAYEEALPADVYVAPAPPPEGGAAQHFGGPAVPGPPPAARHPTGKPGAQRPWRRFAALAPETGGRPMIALVIDDLGVDRKHTARVIAFPAPLTLSFLAYADDLGTQTAAAAAAGHELLVHLSMEPDSATLDPGPHALLRDLGADELRRRLRWGLSRFGAYVGVNNHMGSRFTADAAGMTVVMEELKSRGLLFLDSRTTDKTVAAALARRAGVPFVERNIFLDHVNDVATVQARLAELERLARRNGFAVAIGHPRDATLTALSPWLEEVEGRGFVLVPLTAVVNLARPAG
ncbi:MAG: divergent polysaccharide deacetylase family protein [Rhodospirillales bacterium]